MRLNVMFISVVLYKPVHHKHINGSLRFEGLFNSVSTGIIQNRRAYRIITLRQQMKKVIKIKRRTQTTAVFAYMYMCIVAVLPTRHTSCASVIKALALAVAKQKTHN